MAAACCFTPPCPQAAAATETYAAVFESLAQCTVAPPVAPTPTLPPPPPTPATPTPSTPVSGGPFAFQCIGFVVDQCCNAGNECHAGQRDPRSAVSTLPPHPVFFMQAPQHSACAALDSAPGPRYPTPRWVMPPLGSLAPPVLAAAHRHLATSSYPLIEVHWIHQMCVYCVLS